MDDAEVADRLALEALVVGYATTADARDADGFAALFLPDATLTSRRGEASATYTGTERLAEIPDRLRRYHETFHVVTNHQCQVDGDTARGTALCEAHHVTRNLDSGDGSGTDATDLVLTIRYTDTYRRTTEGWRFATRDVHILWTTELAITLP